MRSLFEKEEKETALNQLKVDLISRFYPFSKDEVLKYQPVLNFDRYHLMSNGNVPWGTDLIESCKDKLDWTAIWKLKNIRIDINFIRTHEDLIDFSSIHLSDDIVWTTELLETYGDRMEWSLTLINRIPYSRRLECLRRYKEKFNWTNVSRALDIDFSEDILLEFEDKWDWQQLSLNRNLPLSVEFIQKHAKQLDFDALSQNPKSLELIYLHPYSPNWNWYNIITNSGISYNDETFNFVFTNFTRASSKKILANPPLKEEFLNHFIKRVFQRHYDDLSYFIQDDFTKFIPWKSLINLSKTKLTMDLILKHKDKLNFKEYKFITNNRDTISREFLEANINLFDPTHHSFYYLPLSIELLNKLDGQIKWTYLSSSEKLDWTWDFIEENFYNFNLFRISANSAVYEKLINEKLSKQEILDFLDKQMACI